MSDVGSVAVVGAGEMGVPMAGHLVAAGYDVTAFDVDAGARERVADRGAALADSPGAAAAAADLTIVVVATSAQVEAVLCDDDGVFPAVGEGHIVALSSTLSPEECRDYARVAPAGVDVIDIPTCRGGGAAERGDLLVLVGGEDDPVERAWAVLETFGAEGDVVHLGGVGTGQVGKAANNTLLWACVVADYEVLGLAQSYGLDVGALREVLYRSSGDNWALHEWDWMHCKWAHKDLAITMDMAYDQDVSMPLAALLSQLVREIDEADLDELR